MNKQSLDAEHMAKAIYDFPDQLEQAVVIGKNFFVNTHGRICHRR